MDNDLEEGTQEGSHGALEEEDRDAPHKEEGNNDGDGEGHEDHHGVGIHGEVVVLAACSDLHAEVPDILPPVAASMDLLLPPIQSDHFVCLLPFHNTVSLDQTATSRPLQPI